MQRQEFLRLGTCRRSAVALVGGAIAIPALCFGQALDVGSLREADDDRTDITHQGLTIDQIEDMNVVREDTLIGEIEEVLIDADERIVAVVVDAASRSPGQRDREVIVPIERLEFDRQARHASTTLTRDEIDALPEWDD